MEIAENECMIGIFASENEDYVLGTSFLQNYFTVFDYAEKKIGLVLTDDTEATIDEVMGPGEEYGILAIIIVSITILVCIVGLITA